MNRLFRVLGLVVVVGLVASAAAQSPVERTDQAKLAQVLVNQCAGIQHGELVLISGGVRDLELLENIAVEVRRLGAHPVVTVESERMARRLLTDVPAKFDAQEPTFAMRLAEIINAHIYIDYSEHPDLLADIPPQRLIDSSKAGLAVEQKMLKRAVRQVYLGNGLYPTKALAKQFNVPQAELSRIFWRGVHTDYTQLEAIGERVRTRLTGGNELEITAPNGTNLTVKIAQRPVYVSDGVISTKDRQEGSPTCQVWLPAGEVYLTPVPGTANGTFVADTYFFEGKPIEGLRLEFKDGRLTKMTAKGDITPLKQRYDAAPEGREVFAFIDIGINPNVEIPRHSHMVSWMAAGTVSVGLGDNSWAGGNNNVGFWMGAHLNGGTLTVDGQPIVEKGKLTSGVIE